MGRNRGRRGLLQTLPSEVHPMRLVELLRSALPQQSLLQRQACQSLRVDARQPLSHGQEGVGPRLKAHGLSLAGQALLCLQRG